MTRSSDAVGPEASVVHRRGVVWALAGVVCGGLACSDGATSMGGDAKFSPPALECPDGARAEEIRFSELRIETRIEKADVGLRCTTADGRRHGPSLEWFGDGQLAARTEWREGEKHGRFEMWYPSGQKRAEGEHRGNLPHGVWTYWESDGTVQQRRDFGDRDAAASQGSPNAPSGAASAAPAAPAQAPGSTPPPAE
jgi:hypothetical protein